MNSFKIKSLIIMLLWLSVSFAQTPIADYSFDVDASDATGNFNGTLEGDAAIVDDTERGKVLKLTETGYVSVPTTIAATMENWTFTAWIDFNGTNDYAAIMGMGLATNGGTPYCDFHVRPNGNLSFYVTESEVWPGDGSAQICDKTLLDVDPGWVHLALTFKVGSGPLFYINGEVQTSTDWNSSNDHDVTPKLIADLIEVVYIGKDTFNQRTLTNTKIDEVKFFDTALTAEEVMAVYNSITSIKEEEASFVSNYKLAQNYPNPFNPETTIKFNIPESSNVKLSVYDITGQEMVVLVNGFINAGTHSVSFNASNLTSGIYFYRLEANGYNTTKRMLLLK